MKAKVYAEDLAKSAAFVEKRGPWIAVGLQFGEHDSITLWGKNAEELLKKLEDMKRTLEVFVHVSA